MRPTFDQTVSVLVKAYFKGTLEHGNCAACAVGNIIASSIGADVERQEFHWKRKGVNVIPIWDEVFCSSGADDQTVIPESYKGWVKRQIDASGYSWEELALIERTFEKHNPLEDQRYNEIDDTTDQEIEEKSMFNGLMSVVSVLAEIHGVDLETTAEAKKLFVKA